MAQAAEENFIHCRSVWNFREFRNYRNSKFSERERGGGGRKWKTLSRTAQSVVQIIINCKGIPKAIGDDDVLAQ